MSKKWVFSILFVLLALTASAHFLLQSAFFSKKIEAFAESTLEKILGKKVQVEGAQLDLLRSSLTLQGLSIYPDLPNQDPLFFAKILQIAFSLDSFFTEVFVIRKVTIDAPEITLTDALVDTFLSLAKTPNPNNASKEKPSSPAFVVRRIQATGGQIAYAGKNALKKATLSGIALEINPDLDMRRFELGFIAKQGTFSTESLNKTIEQFEAELEIQADKIKIKQGTIRSGETALSAHGIIDFSSKTPLSLGINLRLPIDPEITPLLTPPLKAFLAEHRLSGELVFSGNISGAIPAPVFEGALALPRLSAENEAIGSLEGKLTYQAKQLTLSDISGKLFSGTFSGTLQSALSASDTGSAKGLQASLEYGDLPAERLMDFLPRSNDKTAPRLKGLFLSGKMKVSLPKMRMEDMQAQGAVLVRRRALFSPPIAQDVQPLQKGIALFEAGKAQWLWSSGGLILNQATLDFPDLQLAVHGQWHPSKSYAFEVALRSVDVQEVASAFRLPFTGRLHVNGRLSEHADAPAFEGAVFAASGTLQGQFFETFFAEVSLKDRQFDIQEAALHLPPKDEIEKFPSPAGRYTATGVLDFGVPKKPAFDMKVTLSDGNPQEVFRFFHLKIPLYATASGTLSIQGTSESFFVKGPLEISAGSLYGEAFDKGWLDLTVTEKEVVFENVVLNYKKSLISGKGGITYDETYWLSFKADRLRIQETAFLAWMPEALRAQVGLVISGKGSFSEPRLHVVGAVKNLRYGNLQGVRGTIKADWVKQELDFEARFPGKKIVVTGTVQLEPSYPFSFDSTFEALEIAPLFSERVSGPIADMQVRASGKLRGNGSLSEWERVNLSGHLTAVRADFGGYQLQNKGPLPILARDGTFTFQNAHFMGNNTALTLNGNLKVLKSWGLFLKGEVDLNLVTFFSKKISAGSGTAHLDLAVSDRWFSPQLRGELKMKTGKLRTLDLSQPIEVAALSILFNERQVVLENLQGHIGGGNFYATGKAALSGFKVNDFGVLLEMDKVRVDLAKNLPATVSGELFFQKKNRAQTLKGDLVVNNLVYEKKMNLRQFVLDFTQKKRNNFSEETPIIGQTLINIHLYGNEDIWIDNNLAKMPLVIDLLVKGSFDEPSLLGRIDIPGGDIYFRHNTFKIISGAVNFLDLEEINPQFELTARTDVRNIVTDRNYTIDLNLAGTVSQVTLAWNAFPALSDTDILSLLAIRKTPADLALEEGRGAGTEATNFVVSEFLAEPVDQITGMVGEPVEQITGIDNIRVEPSIGGNNASATVGTRLTAEKRLMKDRLVVIYTTTLDPSEEEVIRMVYEINKNISLVGKREEDGQLGGDIRFRFEIR